MRPYKEASTPTNPLKALAMVNEASMRRAYDGLPAAYDKSGDQAGSEAKLGVGTRC